MSSRPLDPLPLAAVAAGGALGAAARFALSEALPASQGVPWSTLLVNVTGSFLLALLAGSAFVRARPLLPPLLGAGVLGGFTTLSAYSEETRILIASDRPLLAAAYASGTLALCLLAVAVAARWTTPEQRRLFDDEGGDR